MVELTVPMLKACFSSAKLLRWRKIPYDIIRYSSVFGEICGHCGSETTTEIKTTGSSLGLMSI
ncbi:MAG: hypothetical protein LBB34_00870 [Holosporales bacterium]|nr:hypothetical protein [Holosporales bacterium]